MKCHFDKGNGVFKIVDKTKKCVKKGQKNLMAYSPFEKYNKKKKLKNGLLAISKEELNKKLKIKNCSPFELKTDRMCSKKPESA